MVVVSDENDVRGLTPRELERELATLASHVYAGTCRWLELVAEFEERGDWSDGRHSYAQWLAWRCGLTTRAAREHVRVARRLRELPQIKRAFGGGEISYAKVRALCRVATEQSEGELLDLANALTAAQLERAMRGYRRATTDEAVALQEEAYVGWTWDDDGALVIRGQLTPEDGAAFLRALEAARDALRGSAEPRSGYRPTNAEALVAMAETSLAGAAAGNSERNQVVVHVDAAALAGDAGECVLEDGPALAPETARRLACDCSTVEVVERDGEPLSVGRKTRTPPSALRRALRTRDHGCRFPGCENHRFCDAHHIRHWAHGGATKLDNLVLLCRRHHRWVHEGGYTVERTADGELLFRDSWGGPIPSNPRSPPTSAAALVEANRPLAIHEWSYETGWCDPMDLEAAVAAIMGALN